MLDTPTLEQRLITLEQVVFDLQHKFDSKPRGAFQFGTKHKYSSKMNC